MELIQHSIIDTNTNEVVNIIDYETEQTGVPPGLEDNLLCVKSDEAGIGWTYINGVFDNPNREAEREAEEQLAKMPTIESLLEKIEALESKLKG